MPNRPEIYKRPSSERYQREYESPDKGFYQSADWRKFRQKLIKKRFKEDYHKAHKLYKQNESLLLREYLDWIASGLPLCNDCFKNGSLYPGRIADHTIPIRLGGNRFDENNIGFLCDKHHQEKRGKERTKNDPTGT